MASSRSSQLTASSLLPPTRPEIITYNRIQYSLYFAAIAWNLLDVGLAIRLRLGRKVLDWANRVLRIQMEETSVRPGFGRSFIRITLFVASLSLALTIWRLPVSFVWYSIEKSYGFATQSLAVWFSDRLAGYAFGLNYIPAVWFGYWLLERSPKRWWLWLWAASVPWLIAVVVMFPLAVDPYYNRFTVLEDSPIKRDILALAQKAGIGDVQVFRVDSSKRSTKVNAYVTGAGPSKRIVIWDTTLKKLPHDQILAVLGHEMGHYVLRHVWRGVVIGTVGSFCLLFLLSRLYPLALSRFGPRAGVSQSNDPASLPIVVFILYALIFLQTPIESAILRYNEHEADRYGLQLTHLNEATARVFAGFVEQNYSEPDPPKFIVFWLYTHPPIRERVEYALSFRH